MLFAVGCLFALCRYYNLHFLIMPNKLINETSPYLLQHAHNPVDWYPWGEEALQKAEKENKPILVSIGYAACHWCHVMEKESFEDEDTAALMNEKFVNIKIDREERPDLDHIYMDAVQAMSGQRRMAAECFSYSGSQTFLWRNLFSTGAAFITGHLEGCADEYFRCIS